MPPRPLSLINTVRSICNEAIMSGTFTQSWKDFFADTFYDSVLNDSLDLLGEELSELFKSVGSSRDQGSLSQAGMAWKKLLFLFMNCQSYNTHILPIHGKVMKKILPDEILQLTNIGINGHENIGVSNDFLLLKLPSKVFHAEVGSDWSDEEVIKRFKELLQNNFNNLEVTIIWAKTNFNDNIQGPMLWSEMARQRDKRNESSKIARHAWVTVPTNRLTSYSSNCAPIRRSRTFDAGSFWGYPSNESLTMRNIFELCDLSDEAKTVRKKPLIGLIDDRRYFNSMNFGNILEM